MDIDLSYSTHYNLQYYIVGIVSQSMHLILIDTGAATSHIDHKLLTTSDNITEIKELIIEGIKGPAHVGNKEAILPICLSANFKKKVKILVVESLNTSFLSCEVLLGMDFLDSFTDYNISKDYLILYEDEQEYKIPRIKLTGTEIRKALEK